MRAVLLIVVAVAAGCLAHGDGGDSGSLPGDENHHPTWRGLDEWGGFPQAYIGYPTSTGSVIEAAAWGETGKGNMDCPRDSRFGQKFDCTDVMQFVDGMVKLASKPQQEALANGKSSLVHVPSGGAHVLFHSDADNLVAGDSNEFGDLFLSWDGRLDLANVGHDGKQDRGFSGSRSEQAFSCAVWCRPGSVSEVGPRVIFSSWDDELVMSDLNGYPDVFLRDLATNQTLLVSEANDGAANDGSFLAPFPTNAVTSDGQVVVFSSHATNLGRNDTQQCLQWEQYVRTPIRACPHVYEWSASGGVLPLGVGTSIQALAMATYASITADGRFVFVEGSSEPDGPTQVFRLDRASGEVVQVTSLAGARTWISVTDSGSAAVYAYAPASGGMQLVLWREGVGEAVVARVDGIIAFPLIAGDGSHVLAALDPSSLGSSSEASRLIARLDLA